jgi:coenzyme PQQ precursor peptide PqqA
LKVRKLENSVTAHGHDSCGVSLGYNAVVSTERAVGGREVRRMAWETPEFVEVRMDAEVTAYQGDLGD